jgi:hypothetical protein
MSEDKESLVRRFREMRQELLAAIDGLAPEQMTERTLDGWSVKDHLFHLAFWDGLRAQEVVRISAGHESALKMDDAQDSLANELSHELCLDLGVEQALWELSMSHEALIRALEQATPLGLEPERYGEAGLLSSHGAEHAGWIRRWRGERGY